MKLVCSKNKVYTNVNHKKLIIRDRSSDLYVGMTVVKMFDSTIGKGERA